MGSDLVERGNVVALSALESELNPRKKSPQTATDIEYKALSDSRAKDVIILFIYYTNTKPKGSTSLHRMFGLRKLLSKFHSIIFIQILLG